MFRSKIHTVTTVVPLVFGIAMIDSAVAGEKMKLHGSSVTTNWKQMEVGDEEGHVMAVYEAKQIYINEKTGEKTVGTSVNTMDINLNTRQGTVRGYGWTVDKDGDKKIRAQEGKSVAKDHWKGTWRYVKGTGKYEGIKGNGIWDSYTIAPQQPSYLEVEAEVEMPGK